MKFARLFSDHAVLQREMPVPVWGWDKAGASVRIFLDGVKIAEAVCDKNGKFSVTLPPQCAGGPHVLQAESDDETIASRDIFFGEVWLAGGQSNMEMPLTGFDKPLMSQDELDSLHFPDNIRMLRVKWKAKTRPCDDVEGDWLLCSDSANYPNISAQAVFFAEKLTKNLGNIPIGIISSNWGGTVAEAWTSREALEKLPFLRDSLARYEEKISAADYWANLPEFGNIENWQHIDELTSWCDYDIKNLFDFLTAHPQLLPQNHHDEQWAAPDLDDTAWTEGNLPGRWTDSHHFSCMGIIWFRKTVHIPDAWAGAPLELRLGAIDKQDVTYFNGRQIGATGEGFDDSHWNEPRVYSVPADAVRAGNAVIAVRAYSFAFNGGLNGPAEAMQLRNASTGETISLAGAWRGFCSLSYNCVPGYLTASWQEDDSPVSYCDAWNTGMLRPNSYHILFDSMIAPLIPCAMKGVIWNQGESNFKQYQYFCDITVNLINDWRARWNLPGFAFIQTLLPDVNDNRNRPQLQQAQREAAQRTGTSYVDGIDLGDPDDIHPRRKRELGYRTADVALREIYKTDASVSVI